MSSSMLMAATSLGRYLPLFFDLTAGTACSRPHQLI